jgi:hypothetical protein
MSDRQRFFISSSPGELADDREAALSRLLKAERLAIAVE